MWTFGLCIVAVLVIYFTYWLNKWSNPRCNGVLPPGSMGLPLIGETLQLIVPSYSLDLHPFIKKRAQRYGPIFRTSVASQPVIVSTNPEFNNYILKQEGRLVEIWYLDTFAKFFGMEGENKMSALGDVHKYIRSIALNHLGADAVKEKLLPQMEEFVNKALQTWSSQPSVDMRNAASKMLFDFGAKIFFSYDAEKISQMKMSEKFTNILAGFMSFPLNIPGTTYYKCLKEQNEALSMLRKIVKEKIISTEKSSEDLLDQAVDDMDKKKFLSEDFLVTMLFAILFASFESSVALSLTMKLIAEHPAVLQQLTDEHEAILKSRENPNSLLTWDEYKSMTFTLQVINEALRMANVTPGLLRKALKDIEFDGYTIPSGWTIMLANSALQLNPNIYKDPLAFNPWRWKDLDPLVVSKNFMPFGGGIRQCAGAEYSKAFMATFLHVLVTKYRWTKIKGGTIARNPVLGFTDVLHIKFSIDSVYFAISMLGYNGITICVSETGWPSKGDVDEVGATLDNASKYNGNLMNMVAQNKVTPLRPNLDLDVYIFALFDENMKLRPTVERNFGLFQPNGMPLYSIRVICGVDSSSAVERYNQIGLMLILCLASIALL